MSRVGVHMHDSFPHRKDYTCFMWKAPYIFIKKMFDEMRLSGEERAEQLAQKLPVFLTFCPEQFAVGV